MVCVPLSSCRGVSLLEAVIASALLATVLTGVAPLVSMAAASVSTARGDVLAAQLARQRLAQIEALAHVRTAAGVSVDVVSRFEGDGFVQTGSGLSPTGLQPLTMPVAGLVDWLDERGTWLGSGAAPPVNAHYARRWAVGSPASDGCVRVWVVVEKLRARAADRRVPFATLQCPWGSEDVS